jgi:hypothetical protein
MQNVDAHPGFVPPTELTVSHYMSIGTPAKPWHKHQGMLGEGIYRRIEA